MFFQLPEKESKNTKSKSHNKQKNKAARRNKKRRLALKTKRLAQEFVKTKQNQQSVPSFQNIQLGMGSWAENFTNAATWQIKHQLAQAKAKIKALEYENKVLRDALWNMYTGDGSKMKEMVENGQSSENESTEIEESEEASQTTALSSNAEKIYRGNQDDSDDDESVRSEDISIDEDYIQHALESHASRQEEARLAKEAEKRREPSPEPENNFEVLKELYGSRWQRIAALEGAMMANFISECDKEKPAYWPNVPLNC